MKATKTILHPTDFSVNSTNALELACVLARDQRARLILLHVVPHPPDVFARDEQAARPLAEHVEEDLKFYQIEMQQKLRRLQVPDPSVPVERHQREGNVSALIVRMAEETGCSLIVMGTHGQTGSIRGLMGSVAGEVVRKAPCPVITVSTPRNVTQSANPSATEDVGHTLSFS